MKVLISAIACQPGLGSEAKVGWDAARAVARIPGVEECHVMTHGAARESVLGAQKEAAAENMRFHFFGKPFRYHPNRMLARLQSWLVYRDWQSCSLERSARLHREHGFFLVHHVTYASWRMPPPLWRMPIPFVFGPVGGGSVTPRAFRSMLGGSASAFEFLRETASAFSANSSSLRLCCSMSSAVVAADTATADFLIKCGATNVHQLCQVFFTANETSRFKRASDASERAAGKLNIFAGGNLEGRKGTQLSLRALAILNSKGIPFSYTHGGWGPDLRAMQQLAQQLGLAEQVRFHEGFRGEEYANQLGSSDVYLLPSIRETAGITMMEAMMAGCYPVVLAGTGAGDIVERTGGTAIRARTPEEAVHKIADKLEWCYRQRGEMQQQSEAAGANMRRLYSESSYQESMSEIYRGAITKHARRLREI